MIGDLFLDSGAHGLYAEHVLKKNGIGRAFFDSDAFDDYFLAYARYVEANHDKFELYANLDVIFDPQKTWHMQKVLENRGLRPVPVVHFDTDLTWLQKYIDGGHKTIAFGGLGKKVTKQKYAAWGDKAFELVLKHAPKTKIHGFAMTSAELLNAYDWHSVDSTSWFQAPRWGSLKIPKWTRGKDNFWETPITVGVSSEKFDPNKRIIEEVYDGRVLVRSYSANRRTREWCETIGIEYRETKEHYGERVKAGIIYYSQLAEAQGTKLYFSGSMARKYRPQDVLDKAHLMPSYYDIHYKNKNIAAEKWA